ncbi:SDR family oxidoreductase [Microbacterium karelineae]|uniref:SDR family oxidoreductase n=1 Tax=Microbacterium karelineae TaxID=2654283 RepID=UPI0012EA4388|nr:SDR family oxidoreductase [Microbacterium karelineae]
MTHTPLRALVTGASSGIGAATVRRLRADGWQVVASARRRERLEELAAETGCEIVVADQTDPGSVAALATTVADDGPLHALVNNAGNAFGLESVDTGDIDRWRAMYELNVLGTLRVTQALLPALRASGRGDIVTITSTAAHGEYPGGAGYTASKHAERQMVKTLRLELGGEPIRVIEIAPGATATEFSLVRFDGDAEKAAAVYAGYEPLVAEDIADAVAWTVTRPHHVNVDTLIIRPRAQVSNTQTFRSTSGG